MSQSSTTIICCCGISSTKSYSNRSEPMWKTPSWFIDDKSHPLNIKYPALLAPKMNRSTTKPGFRSEIQDDGSRPWQHGDIWWHPSHQWMCCRQRSNLRQLHLPRRRSKSGWLWSKQLPKSAVQGQKTGPSIGRAWRRRCTWGHGVNVTAYGAVCTVQ